MAERREKRQKKSKRFVLVDFLDNDGYEALDVERIVSGPLVPNGEVEVDRPEKGGLVRGKIFAFSNTKSNLIRARARGDSGYASDDSTGDADDVVEPDDAFEKRSKKKMLALKENAPTEPHAEQSNLPNAAVSLSAALLSAIAATMNSIAVPKSADSAVAVELRVLNKNLMEHFLPLLKNIDRNLTVLTSKRNDEGEDFGRSCTIQRQNVEAYDVERAAAHYAKYSADATATATTISSSLSEAAATIMAAATTVSSIAATISSTAPAATTISSTAAATTTISSTTAATITTLSSAATTISSSTTAAATTISPTAAAMISSTAPAAITISPIAETTTIPSTTAATTTTISSTAATTTSPTTAATTISFPIKIENGKTVDTFLERVHSHPIESYLSVEKIDELVSEAKTRSKFASSLIFEVFNDEELAGATISGAGGRRKLNTKKVDWVMKTTFSKFPLVPPETLSRKVAWTKCQNIVDTILRRKSRQGGKKSFQNQNIE